MRQFYEIRTYKQYDRDVKLAIRRGLDIEQFTAPAPTPTSSAKVRNGSIWIPEAKERTNPVGRLQESKQGIKFLK